MSQYSPNVEEFENPLTPILNMEFNTDKPSMSSDNGKVLAPSDGDATTKKVSKKKPTKETKESDGAPKKKTAEKKTTERKTSDKKTSEKKKPVEKKREEPPAKRVEPVNDANVVTNSEGEEEDDVSDAESETEKTSAEEAKRRDEEEAKKKKEEEINRKKEEQNKKKRDDAKLRREEAKAKKEEENKKKQEEEKKKQEADKKEDGKTANNGTERQEDVKSKKEVERKSRETENGGKGVNPGTTDGLHEDSSKSNRKRSAREMDNHDVVIDLMKMIKKHKKFQEYTEKPFHDVGKDDIISLKPSTKQELMLVTRFIDAYYPHLLDQDDDPLDDFFA